MKGLLRILILPCVLSIALGDSEVYKWVDENGIVHFTDRAPEDQQSEKVDIADQLLGNDLPETENAAEAWLKKQRAERAAEKQRKKTMAAERRKAAEALGRECNTARQRLTILTTQCAAFFDTAGILRMACPRRPVPFYGEPRWIDDKERASMIEHYTQVIKDCDAAGS